MRKELNDWFQETIGSPYPFQTQAWEAVLARKSGLIHVPTGAGKTYGAYLPALSEVIQSEAGPRGIQILYISPLRAMSRDLQKALLAPVEALNLPFSVESRTGDTSTSLRKRQRTSLPTVLITTPESLSLLLTYKGAEKLFSSLQTAIIDEWHELIDSKRGTQVELALARLRQFAPAPKTWALTATLSNVEEAAQTVVGTDQPFEIITAELPRPVILETAIPAQVDAFPWQGHLGLEMLPHVLEVIDRSSSTLVFTNTRSQAERWFQAIEAARPQLASHLGLHHGSVHRDVRQAVEDGLKTGTYRAVVATSSLDLGVDFAPLEEVIQIGSIKGIARLIQRAGRASHRPGEACRITMIPTQALQLFECAAARKAIEAGRLEPRKALQKPYDVLAQHLVTCALGGGFTDAALFDEIRKAHSYRNLTREEFDYVLALVVHGGETLRGYDFFHRLRENQDKPGLFEIKNNQVARQHRMTIGTIASDPQVLIRFMNRKRLGTVEESFLAKIKIGDVFLVSGKAVKLEKIDGLQAYVSRVNQEPDHVPRWTGGRLPISTSLSEGLREIFAALHSEEATGPEIEAAAPLVRAQKKISALPAQGELLLEELHSREGHHLFLYPFEGYLVHEGLATLLAVRMGRRQPVTISLSINDYGLEYLSNEPLNWKEALEEGLLSPENLIEDIQEALNLGELTRRQFRSVARVAGLVFDGYPGKRKTHRQLQTSAGLLYDVFAKYDPEHLLLLQARREVLELHFQESRLAKALTWMESASWNFRTTSRPSPLAFPLMVDRVSQRVSSETLARRIEKMKEQWTLVE